MKYMLIGAGVLILCVVMIVPISAFMVKQGFANKEKSWAPSAAYTGARIRMRIARYRTAAMILERAIEAWPQEKRVPCAYYWIGLCHEKTKNTVKALEWYGRYTTNYPKHQWHDQAKRRAEIIKANQM